MRVTNSRFQGVVRTVVAAMVLLAIVLPFVSTQAAGPPIYPDLVTPTPAGLRITREVINGEYHYLLRFDNTVANQGGRLELTANLNVSRDVYQNVYDARIGGSLAVRTRVGSDLIFHPQHNHFHFEGIASYEILEKNSTGHYLATRFRGTKTSYCIIDYVRLSSTARTTPQYEFCNASVQGLSAGWGDLYYSSLPDQWVDFGPNMLPDGDYALQSIANPQRKIRESNTSNNTGVRYFTIRNGALVTSGQSPSCTATPSVVEVGDTVQLSCTRLTVGTTVDVRWGSTGGPLLKTVVSADDHKALTSVTIPETSSGAYPIFAVVRSSGSYYGAVVNVGSSLSVSPATQSPGGSVNYLAQGFTGGETVSIRVDGTQVTTKTASVNGTASGSFTLPQARYGAHTISAVGLSSAENASASLSVVPGISLNPAFAYVESAIAPILSGFQSGETVDISIQNGPALKSVQVNSNGGASGSATNLTLPSTVQPGTVTLLARGQSSNAQSTTSLLVLAAGANTPTSTAAATSSPTETAQLDTRRVSTALNMRSGPGTSSNILQVLSAGTIVTVTGSGQNSGGLLFVPIRLQSGATGWVAERYLDPLAPTATATSGGNATATGTATMTATATTASSATATSTQTNNPQSDVRRVRTPLNMRTGPGTSSSILRVLQTGTMVTVTGQGVQSGSYMFVPIELQDGTDGWVAELYLEVMSSTATPAGSATATSTVPSNSMMTTVRLNLRSGPGTTYSSIEIMPAGTILTVTGPTQVGGSYIWAPVRKSNGVTGWAATDFLQSVAGPPPPAAEATQASDVTTVETAISAPVAPLRLDDAVLRWLPEIQSAAQRSGIPAQVIAGVISQTSGGDPNVTGLNGSAGLMMVSPDEFAALGVSTGWHDPATNLSAGASILAGLQSSSGSIEGALAAYFGDGCTSSGYCGADFAADVAASAAAYAPLVDDPANSGIAPLPSEWTAPPAAPYVMDGEVRPVFAPQQAQESDPEPTATEVAPTATSEPVSEEPTEAIEENTDPGQGDSEASPES